MMAPSNDNRPGHAAPEGDPGPPRGAALTPSQRLAALAASAAATQGAQPTASETPAASLIFLRVGQRWFAVPSAAVREVGTKGSVTRVPTTPAHVLGVTLVRGRLVPVLALEGLLGNLGAGEVAPTLPRLVVLRDGDTEIALVCDETRGVIERHLERAAAGPGIAGEAGGRPRFLGVELNWEGRLVCLLDVPALISAATPGAGRGEAA